jgi:hypothetical protein
MQVWTCVGHGCVMTASLLLVGAGHVLRPLGLLYKHRCFPETCHGSSPSQADNEPSCAEGIIVLLYVWVHRCCCQAAG